MRLWACAKGDHASTYPTNKQRVRTAADRVRGAGFNLPKTDEDQALAELHVQFERAVRAAVEREEQARLREQIREEQKRQEEEEEAAERAERERSAIEAALQKVLAEKALAEQKALADQKALVEKALDESEGRHTAEIERQIAELERLRAIHTEEVNRQAAEVELLKIQLSEAEARQRAISEAQKTKVGHVYVISNLGSFGRDVFKIG